jgi:hypothetical protein
MEIETVEAERGEKMITLRVRFWTNDIADKPGHIVPKTCHNRGVVTIGLHEAHGIRPSTGFAGGGFKFNGLHEIPRAIEQCLAHAGIKMVFTP